MSRRTLLSGLGIALLILFAVSATALAVPYELEFPGQSYPQGPRWAGLTVADGDTAVECHVTLAAGPDLPPGRYWKCIVVELWDDQATMVDEEMIAYYFDHSGGPLQQLDEFDWVTEPQYGWEIRVCGTFYLPPGDAWGADWYYQGRPIL